MEAPNLFCRHGLRWLAIRNLVKCSGNASSAAQRFCRINNELIEEAIVIVILGNKCLKGEDQSSRSLSEGWHKPGAGGR